MMKRRSLNPGIFRPQEESIRKDPSTGDRCTMNELMHSNEPQLLIWIFYLASRKTKSLKVIQAYQLMNIQVFNLS